MASKPYNGHKNWSHWNVALWISNDENLYSLARRCIREERTIAEAAQCMLRELQLSHITHTSDGAKYSVTTIRAAMRGL